ncbi:MAG TPA: carbohydrate porin [Chitinophagaceae bacterium]|nr:carbohydrate porin [Chitinophagaceae bacterium]
MFIKKYTAKYICASVSILIVSITKAQQADSLMKEKFSVHAQATVITQYKPAFNAKYTGENSLVPTEETRRSITTTLFLGAKLWKGASVFINPEIAAGSGLSGSFGVGASTNGETYRVDNPAPSFELARLFIRQIIPLSNKGSFQDGDINKLAGNMPNNYLSFTIGKICVADIFDANKYSHDPRTQFMSWALMSNGAWDFPANTRGYTPSAVIEWVTPENELRYGFSLVPTQPNGMAMNWDISKAASHTLEYTHNYFINGKRGALRLVSYLTIANMGNYKETIALNPAAPDLVSNEKYGRTKYGFGINAEQEMNSYMGMFFRASWNDGHNETWAFTEIDHSISAGLSVNGNKWKRNNDNIGIAAVVSGISNDHKAFLQAGGKGFELGDGALNYGFEKLAELYYSAELIKNLYVSGAYQFLINPGYNKDRGAVNVFSVRVHVAL